MVRPKWRSPSMPPSRSASSGSARVTNVSGPSALPSATSLALWVGRMSDAEYWNDLYLKGDTFWDKGAPSPPLLRMLDEGVVPAGGSIAVIGAGRGHDALAAQQRGY